MPGREQRLLEEQQMQMQEAEAMKAKLAEIDAINQRSAIMKQEGINKSHDVEFTEFGGDNSLSETGLETTLGVIGEEEVHEAYQLLLKYKESKADLERAIADNEDFWKLNHWDVMERNFPKGQNDRVKPRSAWLFNTIINKHADMMDSYPEANILPRSRDDEDAAKMLASIIPVIMEQNDYEQTYSDAAWYKCKNGTSVQGVFWDNDKNNGLGDIEIKKIDLLNLYWKSGISNIQDSPNVFHVTMMDNDEIKTRYPMITAMNTSNMLPLSPLEVYDANNSDNTNMSAVIDWYYKKRIKTRDDLGIPKVKTVLHYCKFTNGQVIYASENDPFYADRGWYDDGKYPFVFDVLYPIEGSVCGMGYIDIIKDDQLYIDKIRQAIIESAVVNARPRYAVRTDSNLNEQEFTDISNSIIHFDGNLGEDAFRQIVTSPLNKIYENVYLSEIQQMKDTSGNTASSQGQASSVTSASGIASLQEAAGKLSRDTNKTSYRAYKAVVDMVIERIRQFYNEPRCFRIAGDMGQNEYVSFDNSGLQMQSQGQAFGIDLGSRMPVMDIDVKAQKKNAYSKESQNQTALNLYNLGFFAPNNADASLACLDMMDFDGIEKVKEKVTNNGTLMNMVMQMQQQLMQLGSMVDAQNGTNVTEEIAANQNVIGGQGGKIGSSTGGSGTESKGSLSSQAANAARNSTSPQ